MKKQSIGETLDIICKIYNLKYTSKIKNNLNTIDFYCGGEHMIRYTMLLDEHINANLNVSYELILMDLLEKLNVKL